MTGRARSLGHNAIALNPRERYEVSQNDGEGRGEKKGIDAVYLAVSSSENEIISHPPSRSTRNIRARNVPLHSRG